MDNAAAATAQVVPGPAACEIEPEREGAIRSRWAAPLLRTSLRRHVTRGEDAAMSPVHPTRRFRWACSSIGVVAIPSSTDRVEPERRDPLPEAVPGPGPVNEPAPGT